MFRIDASRTVGRETCERVAHAKTWLGLRFAVENILRIVGASVENPELLADEIKSTMLNKKPFKKVIDNTTLTIVNLIEESQQ